MSETEASSVITEGLDSDIDEENIIKVLIATDIHLGYNEKDPIRGEDSFNTFEEILQIGVSEEVDFILLGGDLFHENKPSIICYHKCISLLKRYCLGDKPVSIEILSDQSRNFAHLKNPVVNYEDPNLNVSIPVFSIHGNHDDPTGEKQLSAMDIIADTGLVNYFGKWTDLNQIEIYPIMIKKGETKLAIYGLSHIKDERLFRLFKDHKVQMLKPQEPDWFNILVLHQNRAQNRGVKNYIPDNLLPEFLNLVVWGHEHDCRLTPEFSTNKVTRITQPGSSVATSLAQGESLQKKVGILCVHKEKFMMKEIELKTVRPFIFREIDISKPEERFTERPVLNEYSQKQILSAVEELLKLAEEKITDDCPKLPLIRLVVNFTDETLVCGNQIRMGQLFNDRVANPNDIFSFKVKRSVRIIKGLHKNIDDVDELVGDELADNLQHLVDQFFTSKEMSLQMLSSRGLCEAVSRFVDANDTDALDDIYKHQFQKSFDRVINTENLKLEGESIDEILKDFREEREKKAEEEISEIARALDPGRPRQKTGRFDNISDDVSVEISDDSDDNDKQKTNGTRGKGKGSDSNTTTTSRRGRGSRGPRARGRGRAKAT